MRNPRLAVVCVVGARLMCGEGRGAATVLAPERGSLARPTAGAMVSLPPAPANLRLFALPPGAGQASQVVGLDLPRWRVAPTGPLSVYVNVDDLTPWHPGERPFWSAIFGLGAHF
jgi:hypothetical protein